VLQVFLAVKENPVLSLLKVYSCQCLLKWKNAAKPCQMLSACSQPQEPVQLEVPTQQAISQHTTQQQQLKALLIHCSASAYLCESFWEEWWIHQKAVLPFSLTWIGWKVGLRGT